MLLFLDIVDARFADSDIATITVFIIEMRTLNSTTMRFVSSPSRLLLGVVEPATVGRRVADLLADSTPVLLGGVVGSLRTKYALAGGGHVG